MSELASTETMISPAPLDRSGPEPADRRLLRGARGGSADAVEALIERHWDQAHRIAYGILGDAHAAEDVTQEAMLSVLGNIGRFDPYRPFQPWLHRIVSNRALDWVRSRNRRAEVSIDSSSQGDGSLFMAPESVADGADPGRSVGLDPELEEALAALSPDHRAVIVLRFVAGYGPKETGQVLGIPTGTVGSRLRRALDQMRTELELENG